MNVRSMRKQLPCAQGTQEGRRGISSARSKWQQFVVKPDAMLLDHYLRAVDRKTAAQYWKIAPPKVRGKVVRKKAGDDLSQRTPSRRPPSRWRTPDAP